MMFVGFGNTLGSTHTSSKVCLVSNTHFIRFK